MSSYEETLKKLNIVVPTASTPVGSYRPVIISGNLAFLSGQISKRADGTMITGKIGKDLTVEQGKEAARVSAINVISIIQHLIGFQKFEKFVRIVGYVQTTPEFSDHSSVTNGASDLFLEVFGEKGIHCRSSIGMASLPLNSAVEIEATLQIRA